ncbi:MAG: TSUP family transporter [Ascidiaceihabitans sp.]|nr:TSUP family transporter [Ascidiaceihabitans sp.]
MSEAFTAAIETPGLWFIVIGALLAGIVRGFSGFGTAMIYLPFAAQVVPPLWAIITLMVMDVIGPIPLVRPAWRASQKRDLFLLLAGSVLLIPVGLSLLDTISPETYRYIVSGIALVLVLCLVFGLRYSGSVSPPVTLGVGALSGFSGGLGGVPGPPAILFYMASTLPVKTVRANMILFLFFTDFLLLGIIGIRGDLAMTPIIIGAMMAIPNAAGNLIGAAIIDPDKAALYRAVAYVIVAGAAIIGLPFWSNLG